MAPRFGADLTTERGKVSATELVGKLQAALGVLNKVHRVLRPMVLANSAPFSTALGRAIKQLEFGSTGLC